MSLPDVRGGSWTLLTGHGHVLVEIARNPQARIRDIAAAAGITERTAQAIVADLEEAGYITRARAGRRTRLQRQPRQLLPPPRPGRTPGRPVPGPARHSQGRRARAD
jgi:MarR family